MKSIRSAATTVAIAAAAAVLGTAAGQALVGQPHAAAPTGSTSGQVAASPWTKFSYEGAFEVERYDQLGVTVRSATVSVLGTVTDVQAGDVLIDSDGKEEMRYQSVVVNVAVDEVLSGAVTDGTSSVDVEFGPFAEEDLASMSFDDLIGQQSIYLLRLKGSGVDSQGITPDPALMKRNMYRVVNSTGLLDEVGGVVEAPLADGDGFVATLEGQPFDQTVSKVDDAG